MTAWSLMLRTPLSEQHIRIILRNVISCDDFILFYIPEWYTIQTNSSIHLRDVGIHTNIGIIPDSLSSLIAVWSVLPRRENLSSVVNPLILMRAIIPAFSIEELPCNTVFFNHTCEDIIEGHISRAWCKTIVTSYIKWGSYNSFAPSPRYTIYRKAIYIKCVLFIHIIKRLNYYNIRTLLQRVCQRTWSEQYATSLLIMTPSSSVGCFCL